MFLLLTLSICIFSWKRYSTKTIVVLILKYLAQQTNLYSKLAAETLKANYRDCASLWTSCSMSETLFKCFLVYCYGCSFVAKLSWKITFLFWKNMFFTKYTLFTEKMFLYGKKKVKYIKTFCWKKLFLQRKI